MYAGTGTIKVHNWTYVDKRSWGPETRWSEAFNEDLEEAEAVGPRRHEQLFRSFNIHCTQGREMLEQLKGVGNMTWTVCSDPELERDTFLQTYELLTIVLSEVKFLELKIDQHLLYEIK